jgi:hypothetical protein
VAEGQRLNALCVGEGDRRLATLAVGEGIDSAFPFPLLLPQSRTEALLTERLAALGVSIERSVELVGLAQDDSGVSATLRHGDGHIETVRTKYLAGCDGAAAPCVSPEYYLRAIPSRLLADVKIDGSNLDHRSIYLWWHSSGTVAMFRSATKSGASSPCAAGLAQDDSSDLEEMQHCVDRWPAQAAHPRPELAVDLPINERLVTSTASGTVWPATPRIHSPRARRYRHPGCGQSRLKLAYAEWYRRRGTLDSYEAERQPIARAIAAAQKQHLSPGEQLWHGPQHGVSIFGNLPAVHRSCRSNYRDRRRHRDGPWLRWLVANVAASARRWARGRAKPRSSMRRAARLPACGPISRRRATAC